MLPLLPLLLLLSLPFLLLLITTNKYKKSNINNLPPSPPKLPLIGNLHQLGPVAHRSLRALSLTYGPLLSLRLGQVPAIVVSSAAAACEVTTTHDAAFASRPLLKVVHKLAYGSKSISSAPYGHYWRQVRKLAVLHLLSSRRVHSYRPVREEEVALLVARIADRSASHGSVNMTQLLSGFANDIICRVALGKEGAKEGEYGRGLVYEYIAERSALAGAFHAEDYFPSLGWLVRCFSGLDAKLERTFSKMDGYLDEVIRSHMAAGRKGGESGADLVHVLLSLQEEHSLTRDEVKAVIMNLFVAGTTTTSILLQWAMSELIQHPAAMKKLQEEVRRIGGTKSSLVSEDDLSEMHYLKAVVKEVLRLHPPVPLLLPRESISEAQLQGYKVPVGTRIIINCWAIGRDPASWEAAEEFLPERFVGSHLDFRGQDFQLIPFGAGRRMCPAIQFAVVDIELALANLVHCFNWKMVDGKSGEQLDMEEAPGITMHRKSDLVLVAEHRQL